MNDLYEANRATMDSFSNYQKSLVLHYLLGKRNGDVGFQRDVIEGVKLAEQFTKDRP